MFFEQLLVFLLAVAVIGVMAHIVGEALPRYFHPDSWFFAQRDWEKALYSALKVQRWKTKLPDKSLYVKGCVKKRLDGRHSAQYAALLVQETCAAEAVHWGLLVISPVLLLIMRPPYAAIATVLYGLSNIPFIIIQRYNRPRLMRLAGRETRAIEVKNEVTV